MHAISTSVIVGTTRSSSAALVRSIRRSGGAFRVRGTSSCSRVDVNRRGTVIGVPFTSVKDPAKMSQLPPYWIFIPNKELTVDWGAQIGATGSAAKSDQVRVLDRQRLGTKIGRVSRTALVSIGLGLAYVFDIQ